MARLRPLTRAEYAVLQARKAGPPTYPQREAVLFALRELRGRDAGDQTEAWQRLFPEAGVGRDEARTSRSQHPEEF
jgi:hypothetical protein